MVFGRMLAWSILLVLLSTGWGCAGAQRSEVGAPEPNAVTTTPVPVNNELDPAGDKGRVTFTRGPSSAEAPRAPGAPGAPGVSEVEVGEPLYATIRLEVPLSKIFDGPNTHFAVLIRQLNSNITGGYRVERALRS